VRHTALICYKNIVKIQKTSKKISKVLKTTKKISETTQGTGETALRKITITPKKKPSTF